MNLRRRLPDLSHLNVKPEADEAYTELNRFLDYNRGLCYDNPEPFTADSIADSPMAILNATKICADCPALALCQKFARLEQPEGPLVQGGEYYPETTLEEDAVQDH